MAVELKRHDRRFHRLLNRRLAEGLKHAAEFYREECRSAVGRRNPDGREPSRPGDPPRRVTGKGRASIVMEVDRRRPAARVGVTSEGMHLIRLETGTRTVRPRPWLIPTLLNNRLAIGRLAVTAAGEPRTNRNSSR